MTDTVHAAREVRRHQRAAVVDYAGARIDSPDDGVSARAPVAVAPPPTIRLPILLPRAWRRHRRRRCSSGATPPPNVSPQRTYDSAYSDYAAGQHDLAIVGFQTFRSSFRAT